MRTGARFHGGGDRDRWRWAWDSTSAVTSLAYALFLKPLPVDDASRVVLVGQPRADRPGGSGVSYPDYLYFAITRACSPIWPRTTRHRP